ncbi:asparagine synthase-related protein [Cellvibrio sp. UBA7671]|uniref:asparagine synthase-related protein n=1 Tax=Cellvibrio sp. UBA7671 TaxID=1946312 RepID=UPI002F351D58
MLLGFRALFSFDEIPSESPRFCVRGEQSGQSGQIADVVYKVDIISINGSAKHKLNDHFALICGQITNASELRKMFHSRTGILLDSDEAIIASFFENYGVTGFSFFEGLFVAAFISGDGTINVFSSKTAGPTVYYSFDAQARTLFLATELKAFPSSVRKVREFDDFSADTLSNRKINTILEDVFRVPAGHAFSFNLRDSAEPQLQQYYSQNRSIAYCDEENAASMVESALRKTVFAYQGERANCLISGGLDSSVVAYLANERFSELNLFSIGTTSSNEFEFADKFARSIGKNFERILIEENDFLAHLPELLWLTEHPYSTFNEYLIPVHIAHAKVNKEADIMLSGYGSDVLFAGFAKPETSLLDVTTLIREEYETTFWSNEASQTLGGVHGFNVGYPFFDSSVVDLSFSIDPYLKHKNGIEKYILRKTFEGKIQHDVLYRKKIGIHQGTGCEAYFTHRLNSLGIYDNMRLEKDRYCYSILRILLEGNYLPDDIIFSEVDVLFLQSRDIPTNT